MELTRINNKEGRKGEVHIGYLAEMDGVSNRFLLKMMCCVCHALVVMLLSLSLQASDVLPAKPDYNSPKQWYVSDRQSAADIFYVISTETGDYRLPDGSLCHRCKCSAVVA